MPNSLWPHGLQHTRLPCPSLSPRVCSNSCPLSRWCHPTNSSSASLFSSCLQSFPASGSFPMSGLFASGDQSIGASASASVLPMAIQGWFPLELRGYLVLPFWSYFVVLQLLSCFQLFVRPWTSLSPSSGPCSNSCPLSWWCHPTISSSVIPFSSCLQPSPASGSFPMSGLFASGGQSNGVSVSASVLPMNIHGWFPLGWTGLISLKSKWLRVLSNFFKP